MKHYQAFILTFQGNVVEQRAVVCADEAEAIEQSKRLIGSLAVELWDGSRWLARFAAATR